MSGSPDQAEAVLPAVRVEDDTQVRVGTATAVLISFDDLVFDTAEMHSGNNREDRIRLTRGGTYVLVGEVEWEPSTDGGYRTLELVLLNRGGGSLGKTLVEPRNSAIQPTIQQVTAIVRQPAGAAVGLLAGQASGVALEVVRATLSAAFLGP